MRPGRLLGRLSLERCRHTLHLALHLIPLERQRLLVVIRH
jgi:hypothetical protein